MKLKDIQKLATTRKKSKTDTALQGEKLSAIEEEEKTVEMNWVLESDMKEMERRHAIRQRMLGARQLDLGEVFDKERRRSSTTPPKALDRQEMALYKERREEDKRSAEKEEKGIEGEHEKEETLGVGEGEEDVCNSSSAREQKEEINEIIPTKEQKNWRTSKEFFYNSKIGALGLRTTTDSSFTQDSPSKSLIRENRGNSFNRTKPQLRSSVGDKKHVTLGIKRLEKDHLVAEEEKETQEDTDQDKKVEIKKADEKEEREKHNQKLGDEETTVGEEKPKEERERKQHVMRHSKEKKEKPKTNSRQKDERRDNESFEPFAIDILGLLSPRQKKVENPVWKAPELFVDESNLSKKADVYSYGVILWELVTRADYFGHIRFMCQIEDHVVRGERPDIPSDCLPEFAQLIRDCWQGDQNLRPSFEEILMRLEKLTMSYSMQMSFQSSALQTHQTSHSLYSLISPRGISMSASTEGRGGRSETERELRRSKKDYMEHELEESTWPSSSSYKVGDEEEEEEDGHRSGKRASPSSSSKKEKSRKKVSSHPRLLNKINWTGLS